MLTGGFKKELSLSNGCIIYSSLISSSDFSTNFFLDFFFFAFLSSVASSSVLAGVDVKGPVASPSSHLVDEGNCFVGSSPEDSSE